MKKTSLDHVNWFLALILLLVIVLVFIVILPGWPEWMRDGWKRLTAWGLFLFTILTLRLVWPRTTKELEHTSQAVSDSGARDVTESQPPKTGKRVDVLLAEYEAANRNRDHYDSVRWTIGSIFVAASLILFGYSSIDRSRGRNRIVDRLTLRVNRSLGTRIEPLLSVSDRSTNIPRVHHTVRT